MPTPPKSFLPVGALAVALIGWLIVSAPVAEGQGQVTINRLSGITYNAGRIPVLADINNGSQVDPSNRAQVVGCVANDADGTSCYPVFIGGNGTTAVPSATSADGDSVRAWFSRTGALHTLSTAGTSTKTNTNDSASSAAIVAANTARLAVECFNDSTTILYVNYGSTASATAFTELVQPQSLWRMDEPIYTGAINGIWSADASGASRCTELTQ